MVEESSTVTNHDATAHDLFNVYFRKEEFINSI